MKNSSLIRHIQDPLYTVSKNYFTRRFWKISNVVLTLRKPNTPLKEENPRRRGKVYNWETATYGKIWDNEDVHDLESVETEFPSIVFNDTLTFEATLSSEPTISSLNNDEIDFRVSFDESDDEDCTPTVSYFDDLDYFKDFEKEFPAVVYNDALTSKLDFLTEPTVSPQHIDEYNLKDETSLSECNEEEQNILIFNDLFPFDVIHPNDSKSEKDNDDDKVEIEHSSGDLSVKPLPDVINTDVGAYAHGTPVKENIGRNIGGGNYEYGNLEVLEFENIKTDVHTTLDS
ncbi:hypothetical protein Tco_0215086 [Tanacetum coccineum]